MTERTRRTVGVQPKHARLRRIVLLPDGRTARLQWVAKYGTHGRVVLPSGVRLNIDATQVTLVEEP